MKIKIIFGSEVGTTQYVAELMSKMLTDRGHEVDLHHVGLKGVQPVINDYEVLLFGSPTYYGGNLEQKMDKFVKEFKQSLGQFKIGIFSLGDSGYEHFCGSARILEDWVVNSGGKISLPTLKIDGYPHDTASIKQWVDEVCTL